MRKSVQIKRMLCEFMCSVFRIVMLKCKSKYVILNVHPQITTKTKFSSNV